MQEITPFRRKHLLQVLQDSEQATRPSDAALSTYFHIHRTIGSKDRRWISETFYGMIRWSGLIDYFSPRPISNENRIETYLKLNPSECLQDISIPAHVRVSFPKHFYNLLVESLGFEKAWGFCQASNDQAPTTVRVNLLKSSRDDLLARWKDFQAFPCKDSSSGIVFPQRVNFFGLPEFKEGLFEVQDEASQLVSARIEAGPGDQVLDFCSGSGGKTLAFAHLLEGKGQIYLHDVRSAALEQAKKRLHRAGIQNSQLLLNDSPQKTRLKGKMDWVLVDTPCSGSGTLRRNPDMKWKFSPEDLTRLVLLQREIFQEALQYLKPGGKIVYSTCSIFPQENEEQARYFEENFNVESLPPHFFSFPAKGGMDGFFAATFKRT